MKIEDEKTNLILEEARKYREGLALDMNTFKNMEFDDDDIKAAFKLIFWGNEKTANVNDKNNIFLKCLVTNKEALNGCVKKVKYNQICENGKKQKNIISVKIPKGIQNNQRIIIHNNGNYVKAENRMSDLIIKVEIK